MAAGDTRIPTPGSAVPPSVPAWAPTTSYSAGQLVAYRGSTWLAVATFTSGAAFVVANWALVGCPGPYGFPYTLDPGVIRGGDFQPVVSGGADYWVTREGGTISKIGISVGVQSGNISVACHAGTGLGRANVPGARLATSGAVACPAPGYSEISLDVAVTLIPGDWIGLSADNATATFQSLLASGVDSNLGLGRQLRQVAAHPLPATPSGLVATIGRTIVLIGVA